MTTQAMLLITFDFDHTVVDGNTDVKVLDVLNEKDHGLSYSDKTGWTEYMRQIYVEFEKRGVTRGQIEASLKELRLTKGMKELLQFIRDNRSQIDVIIASDSNSWFIETLLAHFQISDLVDEIHTNPARWDAGNSLLMIERYTTNKGCQRCPVNMCKGAIVGPRKDAYSSIVYIGDGSNDLCPVLHLGSGDLACPREEYKLARLLRSKAGEVLCSVEPWSDAACLVPSLQKALNKGRTGREVRRGSSLEAVNSAGV